MKHLKLFNDTVSYETWKNSEGFVIPNVSYIIEGNIVRYEPVIMDYPDILLQKDNTYPEVGARLSQMFNKYMAKYNRTIIQSPYDEPNSTMQFEIDILEPGEYPDDNEMHAPICFYKLDETGGLVSDESPEVWGPGVELEIDDINYLMSLKYFDGYDNSNLFDYGYGAEFYPTGVRTKTFGISAIGFDGTLTLSLIPE